MKPRIYLLVLALFVTPAVIGQGPVTTGTVVSVTKEAGTIIVNSTQTGQPITMYGLEKAAVMNPTGTALTLADVKPGALVSVHYQPRGDRWFVSRIVVPPTAPAVPAAIPTLTVPEAAATKSKAANDGDITTQPGTKARIDGDRTTQPGKKDPADPDITKRPDNK